MKVNLSPRKDHAIKVEQWYFSLAFHAIGGLFLKVHLLATRAITRLFILVLTLYKNRRCLLSLPLQFSPKKEDIWLWLSWFHIKMGDKRKMDKPRALSLMGFSTSRPIGKIFHFCEKICDFMSSFQMHILVNLTKYGKFWIKLFLKELNKWCMAPKRKLRNKTSKWRKSKVMLHELNFEFFHHKKLPNSFKSSNSTPVLLWTIQKKFSTLG